jgi:PAS domain S-box-containing protein
MRTTMRVPLFLTDLVDSLTHGLVAVDLAQTVIHVNRTTRELFGLGQNLTGRPCAEIFPALAPLLAQCLESKEAEHNHSLVEHGFRLFCDLAPLRGNGRVMGATACLYQRWQLEKAASDLNSTELLLRQLQAMFDSSSDGIWTCDANGVVLDMNSASERFKGIKAGHVIGRPVEDLVDLGLIDHPLTTEVLRKREQVSAVQHVPATGKKLLVTGTPAFDPTGQIFMVVVNERDVTDLNRLQEQLLREERVREKAQNELKELAMLELESKGIVAESPAMRRLLAMALKMATLDTLEALILGESGTGKGLLASFIHKHSPRRDKPFIPVNCAALPENLFEAELFGYEEGAFTGARRGGKPGLFELAGLGTIFLDEVGELPITVQAKLLKCLDDRSYLPLGGEVPKKVHCAVITATNRNLERLVQAKKFRKDLFYRLNTFTLKIPPLRERGEDIFELATLYLRRFNDEFGAAKRMTHSGMKRLLNHGFPGNVRELIGLVKKAVIMSEGDLLDDYLAQILGSSKTSDKVLAAQEPLRNLEEELLIHERGLLVRGMSVCSSQRCLAEYLGVSQPTIARRLQKHGLNWG